MVNEKEKFSPCEESEYDPVLLDETDFMEQLSPSSPELSVNQDMCGKWLPRSGMSGADIKLLRRESISHIDVTAMKLRPNLSFSGCGFNGMYHVGVCAALQEYAPHLYEDNMISGTSAGSIAAAFLLCDLSMRKCAETMMDLIASCKREGMMFSKFNLNSYLKNSLDKILPDDAHIKCSGKLHVSMTKIVYTPLYAFQNFVVSKFATKEELITAIMCSSFIPMVSGFYFPEFKGISVMDGGFSNNLIEMNDATITVTPFMAEADICPIGSSVPNGIFDIYNTRMKLTFFNLERLANLIFPNSAQRMCKLLELGYNDCIRYLLLRKLIFCNEHSKVFAETGRKASDDCHHCHELVEHAAESKVPSYLKEMIFEKEPVTYSYWGSVLDNRITSAIFAISDLCSHNTDIQYMELCRSMDVFRSLREFPFIRITLKPIEWYFWIFRMIWSMIRPNDTKAIEKNSVRRPSTLKASTSTEPQKVDQLRDGPESVMNMEDRAPVFYIPDDDVLKELKTDVNSNNIEAFIASAMNNPALRDSGLQWNSTFDDSIAELISFERMREEKEIAYYTKIFPKGSENESGIVSDILDNVDASSCCDSDVALSLDF